jgi:hypothetical protein
MRVIKREKIPVVEPITIEFNEEEREMLIYISSFGDLISNSLEGMQGCYGVKIPSRDVVYAFLLSLLNCAKY